MNFSNMATLTSEHIKKTLKDFKLTCHKVNYYDPVISVTSKRVFKMKDEYDNKFKLYDFTGKILIELNAQTSLLFSVNLPNNIFLANKLLKNKLYAKRSNDNFVSDCFNLIRKDINNISLLKDEALFVYRNGIHLLIRNTRELLPVIIFLQKVKRTIEYHFPDVDETIDISKFPAEFKNLLHVIKEWAIADDTKREEKIKRSSQIKIQKVIDAVSPKMNSINNYLNSFKDEPISYEASLLGNLAELITELSLIKRKG